ncbi:PhnA domain-containing protein [Sodalis praecaptivus]
MKPFTQKNLQTQIDGFGAMKLKSEFVKKI